MSDFYPILAFHCGLFHRYVIMAQMRALETPDPFNDDFYYHNAMRRKQEKHHRDMLRGAEPHATVGSRCEGGSACCS